MGVIPSGTSEPWFWAAREAAANDALARLFYQLADKEDDREFRRGEREIDRADTESRFQRQQELTRENWQRQDKSTADYRTWQEEQADKQRQHQLDLEERRANRPNLRYGRSAAATDIDPNVITPNVEQAWRESEKKHGLPPGTLNALYGAENSGGRNVGKNPESSAAGHFQFVDKTLKDMGIDPADRSDPIKMGEHAARLAAMNRDAVKSKVPFAGNASDIPKYYILHQQGSGGGAEILMNPKGKIMDNPSMVANPERGSKNGAKYGMTNEQFTRMYANKILPYYTNWHTRTEGGTKVAGVPSVPGAPNEGERVPGYAGVNPIPPQAGNKLLPPGMPQAAVDYLKQRPGTGPQTARDFGFPDDTAIRTLPAPLPSPYPGGGGANAALPPAEAVPPQAQPGRTISPPQLVPQPQSAPPSPPGVPVTPPIFGGAFPGPSGGLPDVRPGGAVLGLPQIQMKPPAGGAPDLSTTSIPPPADMPQPPAQPDELPRNPFGLPDKPGWAFDYLPAWAGGRTPPSAGMPAPGSSAPIDPRSVKTQSVAPIAPTQRPAALPPSGGGSVAPSSAGSGGASTTKTVRYGRMPDGKPGIYGPDGVLRPVE